MPYTVWIWDISTLEVKTIISFSSPVKMFKWHKEENKLCITCGNNRVLFWKDDIILECSLPSFSQNKFNIQRFSWSSDGKRLLLFDNKEVMYADLVNQ